MSAEAAGQPRGRTPGPPRPTACLLISLLGAAVMVLFAYVFLPITTVYAAVPRLWSNPPSLSRALPHPAPWTTPLLLPILGRAVPGSESFPRAATPWQSLRLHHSKTGSLPSSDASPGAGWWAAAIASGLSAAMAVVCGAGRGVGRTLRRILSFFPLLLLPRDSPQDGFVAQPSARRRTADPSTDLLSCSILNPGACDAVQLEIMYLDALRLYHMEGRPAISDALYDRLKTELAWQGSWVPFFGRRRLLFFQRLLQYARGKPEMSETELRELQATLRLEAQNEDTRAFLEFMKLLRRTVEAKNPATATMAATTGGVLEAARASPRFQEFERRPGEKILFSATQHSEIRVTEHSAPGRSLVEYLRLPPTQYSTNVLRAKTVTRLGDDTFRCELEGLHFFGLHVVPVLTAKVTVDTVTPSSFIEVVDCHLKGRERASDAGKYVILSQNRLSWKRGEDQAQVSMINRCYVQVGLMKPRWLLAPTSLAQRYGSAIVQAVLRRMTEDFLVSLERDYQAWAQGDPDRPMWVTQPHTRETPSEPLRR